MNLGNFVKSIQNIMRQDSGINGDAQRLEQMTWILFLKIYDAQEENWEVEEEDYQSIIPENLRWKNWAVDKKDGKALTGESLLNFVNNELFPTLKNLQVSDSTPIKKAVVPLVFQDTNQYMKDGVLLRELVNKIDEVKIDTLEQVHALGNIYETILKSLQSAGNAGEFYTPRAVTDFIIDRINPQLGEVIADFACGTGGFLTSGLKHLEKQIVTADDRVKFHQSIYGIEKKPLPYLLAITNMLLHGIDSPYIINANSLERDVKSYSEDEKFSVVVMNPPYGGMETNNIKNNFPKDLQSNETADLFIALAMYRLKIDGRAAVIIPDGFLFGADGAKLALKKKLITEFNLHTIIRLPASVFAPYTSITTNILFFDKNFATKKIWFYRVDIPEGYKHFSKSKPMKFEHFAACQEWWDNRRVIEDSTTETFKAKDFFAAEIVDRNFDLDLCGYPSQDVEILSPFETIQDFQNRFSQLNKILSEQVENIFSLLKGENLNLKSNNNISNSAFELANILKEFPRKMKASLLQAAIQGKLSQQLPTDGDARALLREIQAEKLRLIAEKKIKAAPPLPPITADEIPFEIPQNWQWVRLGDICNYGESESISPQNMTLGKFLLDLEDIEKNSGKLINKKFFDGNNAKSSKSIFYKGNVLYGKLRPYLNKVLVADEDGYCTSEILPLDFGENIFNGYAKIFFMTPFFSNYATQSSCGTKMPRLRTEDGKKALFPLPPLAEQKRIVAKLEKVLPLCDRLAEKLK